MLAQHPQRVLRVWSSVSVGWVGGLHDTLCPTISGDGDRPEVSVFNAPLASSPGWSAPGPFLSHPTPQSSLTKGLPHLGAHQIWGPSGGTDF